MDYIGDEAYLNAYERLRELDPRTLLAILVEWEMNNLFGEAADHVWADEWLKQEARVKNRYVRTKYRPHTSAYRMVGDIWREARVSKTPIDADEAELCPYGCWDHTVPVGP